MIRVGTILSLSLAVAAGIGLFHAKHRVQALEAELSGIQQQILRDREAIHVLKAEWSFLNEPDRLAEFARRHLEMAPISGSQFATLDDIPEKLPPPPAETPGESPAEDDAPAGHAPEPAGEAQIVAAPEAAPTTPTKLAPAPVQPPFAELPADVQAVLASMRNAE